MGQFLLPFFSSRLAFTVEAIQCQVIEPFTDSPAMPLHSSSRKRARSSCKSLAPLQPREIFPFLSLPTELRQQIYSYVFVSDDFSFVREGLHTFKLNDVWKTNHSTIPRKALNIRLVCRQIHEETTEFIFERATVEIIAYSFPLLERKLEETTLPAGANWRRIRRLCITIIPFVLVEVKASYLSDLERFLKKYFPLHKRGKVNLTKLSVYVSWNRMEASAKRFGTPRVKLPDEHPVSRWAAAWADLLDSTFRVY